MKERIIELVQNACALEENVEESSALKALSLDSLSFVGVLVELEEAFEIEFGFDELGVSDWETVGDIIKSVERKINEKE